MDEMKAKLIAEDVKIPLGTYLENLLKSHSLVLSSISGHLAHRLKENVNSKNKYQAHAAYIGDPLTQCYFELMAACGHITKALGVWEMGVQSGYETKEGGI